VSATTGTNPDARPGAAPAARATVVAPATVPVADPEVGGRVVAAVAPVGATAERKRHVADTHADALSAPNAGAVPGAAAVVPVGAAGVVDGAGLVTDDVDPVVEDREIGIRVDVGDGWSRTRGVGRGVGVAVDPGGAAG